MSGVIMENEIPMIVTAIGIGHCRGRRVDWNSDCADGEIYRIDYIYSLTLNFRDMNVKEAIEKRKSVRNYDSRPLPEATIGKLREFMEEAESPFGGKWQLALQYVGDEFDPSFSPGTYGVIHGAKTYFLVGHDPEDINAALSAGYAMEDVVVKATMMKLGTCWLGGTFRKSAFTAAENFEEDVKLLEVVAVGQAAKRSGMMNSLMRTMAGSSRRKPVEELFFETQPCRYLGVGNRWRRPLELMRWAPSSTNSQPWRAIVHGDRVDFFTAREGDMAYIDMGIGLRHFSLGADEAGLHGEFRKMESVPTPDDWVYVTSYFRDGYDD